MRGRLITNGFLSIITFIAYAFLIFTVAKTIVNGKELDNNNINYLFLVILIPLWIANFIMGIVTLSMEKHVSVKGLTVASGVIAILNGIFGLTGGLLFINAIVSFIGAFKIKNFEKIRML